MKYMHADSVDVCDSAAGRRSSYMAGRLKPNKNIRLCAVIGQTHKLCHKTLFLLSPPAPSLPAALICYLTRGGSSKHQSACVCVCVCEPVVCVCVCNYTA